MVQVVATAEQGAAWLRECVVRAEQRPPHGRSRGWSQSVPTYSQSQSQSHRLGLSVPPFPCLLRLEPELEPWATHGYSKGAAASGHAR